MATYKSSTWLACFKESIKLRQCWNNWLRTRQIELLSAVTNLISYSISGTGPVALDLSTKVWRLQPQDAAFGTSSNSGGCLKSSRPGWAADKSRSIFRQSQCFHTAVGTERARVPAASLVITVRAGVQLGCRKPRDQEPPTSFQGRSKHLPAVTGRASSLQSAGWGRRLTLALLLVTRLTV